jgi:hypothetical protein
MGKIDDDELFTVFLINALGDHFTHLQSAIPNHFCLSLVLFQFYCAMY